MIERYLITGTLIALIAILGTYQGIRLNPIHTQNGTAIITVKSDDYQYKVLPTNLSSKQADLLAYAYDIAKIDGHKDPAILQGLILTESNAGGAPNYRVSKDKSGLNYGVAQLRVEAAKDVLKAWPDIYSAFGFQTRSDDEIRANLILNDRFNIYVASKYLMLLETSYNFSGFAEILRAYNRGPAAARSLKSAAINDKYVIKTKHNIKTLLTSI